MLKKKHMEKKLHQLPLGGLETNEDIIKEAEHAVTEEERTRNERKLIEEAMREAGFISYEERRKMREEGPGRKAARELLEKMRNESEKPKEKDEDLF